MHLTCVCVYQEAGGVVEEAAKAAAEAPLQEGRVLWWQLLRVVIYDGGGDVAGLLEAYREKTMHYYKNENEAAEQIDQRIHPNVLFIYYLDTVS